MIPARRQEYLQAMGIEVWVPRLAGGAVGDPEDKPLPATSRIQPMSDGARASDVSSEIVIGPGSGSTLLLVGKSEEAATALAADIARSLDNEPVWSWPARRDSVSAVSLEQAIKERLITRILVFGPSSLVSAAGLAADVIGTAQLIRAESITVLLESGAAKRALWAELCASRWCAERARKT